MEDTSGFYKKTEDGSWLYAPNFVYNKDYSLERGGNRESIDGWVWHEAAPHDYIMWLLMKNSQEQIPFEPKEDDEDDTPAN